jgi:hypothetical protein
VKREFIVGGASEYDNSPKPAMRKEFLEGGDFENDYSDAPGRFITADGEELDRLPGLVVHDAPWAYIAVEVEGGYLAFESFADYEIWNCHNERR